MAGMKVKKKSRQQHCQTVRFAQGHGHCTGGGGAAAGWGIWA